MLLEVKYYHEFLGDAYLGPGEVTKKLLAYVKKMFIIRSSDIIKNDYDNQPA
jgi:hypothetical protein